MIKQLFLKYLNQFELILHLYKYVKNTEDSNISVNYRENLTIRYVNKIINRSISIRYTIWGNDSLLISVSMYKIPDKGTFFSLIDYLKNHNLKDKIVSELPAGDDIEPFIKKYFEDLESLFKNELNDQITGKTFENHMDALNESWNQHRDVAYKMEKDEIDKFNKSKKR